MPKPDSLLRQPAFRRYLLGLLCVVAGAGGTSLTGSMWPLAMGSSVAVMYTAGWVAHIRGRAALRRAKGTSPPAKRR